MSSNEFTCLGLKLYVMCELWVTHEWEFNYAQILIIVIIIIIIIIFIIIKVTNWTPILIFKLKFKILQTYMYSTCIYKEM